MAKRTVNLNALKPIMNILELKMKQEVGNINADQEVEILKQIEKENENLIKSEKVQKLKKAVNDAVDALNEELVSINEQVGGNAYSLRQRIDEIYFNNPKSVKTGVGKYDYEYLRITDMQYTKAMADIESKKDMISLKYENIKAQIMLADDYAQIRDILLGYNISLDEPTVTNIAD